MHVIAEKGNSTEEGTKGKEESLEMDETILCS